MTLNKSHVLHEVSMLKMGAVFGVANEAAGDLSYISQVSAIANTPGIPDHFAKDLEKVKEKDYLLEEARTKVRFQHRGLTPDAENSFVAQQQRFLKISAAQAILDGIEQYLKADPSFRMAGVMEQHHKSLKKAVRDKKVFWRRFIETFVLLFTKEILPSYPQHKKELEALLKQFQEIFVIEKPPIKEEEKDFVKRADVLMDDIRIFFRNHCEGVSPAVDIEPVVEEVGVVEMAPDEMDSDTISR